MHASSHQKSDSSRSLPVARRCCPMFRTAMDGPSQQQWCNLVTRIYQSKDHASAAVVRHFLLSASAMLDWRASSHRTTARYSLPVPALVGYRPSGSQPELRSPYLSSHIKHTHTALVAGHRQGGGAWIRAPLSRPIRNFVA